MLTAGIQFDEAQIRKAFIALSGIPGGAETAVCRAINRAVDRGKTQTVREICSQYNIKPSQVRSHMRVLRATRANLSAVILQTGSPLELMIFARKPKKPPKQKGVEVSARTKVVAGVHFGVFKTLPHVFVAKMSNGHIGIYSRKGTKTLPIEQKYTTSVPQMMKNAKVMDRLVEATQKIMTAELDRQIELLLMQRR